MIAAFLAFQAVSVLGMAPPLVFLEPTDIEQADNVEIRLRQPEQKRTLIPADSERPSLWYAPVAVRAVDERTFVWYQRIERDLPEFADRRTLCLGMILGDRWVTPELHRQPPPWGGFNNIVMRRSPHEPTWGGFNVFQIVMHAGNYHMVYWDQPAEGEAGALHAVSPDGVHWTTDPPEPLFTERNDAFTIVRGDGEFLMFQTALVDWPDKPFEDNLPGRRRVQSLRTSPDLINWTDQEIILTPDDDDKPHTEFYYMRPFQYFGRYAALLMKYYADPDRPGRHSALTETELIVSDDGRAWRRPFRKTNLGFWTASEPYVDESQHLCFVAGEGSAMVVHKYRQMHMTAITTATEGEFVTPVIDLTEADLVMDAHAPNGSIEVELLDSEGEPVPGLWPTFYEAFSEDSIVLMWEHFSTGTLPLTECRLRISLNNATLYAIREFD